MWALGKSVSATFAFLRTKHLPPESPSLRGGMKGTTWYGHLFKSTHKRQLRTVWTKAIWQQQCSYYMYIYISYMLHTLAYKDMLVFKFYKYIFTCIFTFHLHTYLPTYIHTYIHTHTHIHKDTQRHTKTHIHTYMHTYMHACMHTYIHTDIHTYIHTDRHTYIHTYTHTHIHTYTHTCT